MVFGLAPFETDDYRLIDAKKIGMNVSGMSQGNFPFFCRKFKMLKNFKSRESEEEKGYTYSDWSMGFGLTGTDCESVRTIFQKASHL